jgi:hypothetical protein
VGDDASGLTPERCRKGRALHAGALRGPVVGRKNQYGSRSLRGTQVAAVFYTLCERPALRPSTRLPICCAPSTPQSPDRAPSRFLTI